MENSYNGWKNYETWVVALWLDDTESTRQEATELASTGTMDEATSRMKTWIAEDMNPLADQNSIHVDLLASALQEVDWSAVVKRFREEDR